VSTLGHAVVCQILIVCSFFNKLILGWELGSTHIVNRLLKLMNTKCRMLSAQPCRAYSMVYSLSCHMLPTLAEYQPYLYSHLLYFSYHLCCSEDGEDVKYLGEEFF
jgi:hypothetical protein